jgi:predicted RNase H-like HicB family nuclease
MHFDIYIDGHPETHWMGHALAETGCIWITPTREEVAAAAPEAIAGFCAWLRRHGEPRAAAVQPGEITVAVIETREVPRLGISGAAVGFFEPDREPVTDEAIAVALRRLGYARLDLFEAVSMPSPEALHWRPPGKERTITENLLHMRNAQFFYLDRLFDKAALNALLPPPWPEATFESLQWIHAQVQRILLELPERYRAGIFPAREPQEDWTARKMLRRFVEHELEHLAVVRRTAGQWQTASGSA